MTMRFDLRQLGRHKGGSLREEHVERTFQASEFEASVGQDEEYKVAGYFFPTLGGNTITAFYGFPRTVTGTVSFRF